MVNGTWMVCDQITDLSNVCGDITTRLLAIVLIVLILLILLNNNTEKVKRLKFLSMK